MQALVQQRLFFAGVLVVLGVGWGSTQSLGKMATATGYQPFGLIFWQLFVCSVVLGVVSAVRRKGLVFTREAIRFYVVIAVIGTIIPNAAFYAAVHHLPAGIMSIVISTVPMIAFPMALVLGIDRFTPMRIAGLLLGLFGVGLIASDGGSFAIGMSRDALIGWLLLALVGPFFYACEATYVARNGTAGMDAVQAMFGASVAGLILALPIAILSGHWVTPDFPFQRPEWALVIASSVHALVYAAYVWLAGRAGSVFASQSAYLVTLSGVFWAMILLGERFSPVVWVALVVMLAGVALVQPRSAQTPLVQTP
jgi:drug/metabolite transporter (DMT)-like permease